MAAHSFFRATALSVLVPVVLVGQVAREHDITRMTNWPAPLYWQPAVAAAPEATGTSLPIGPSALVFVAMPPCRVLDTRTGQGFSGAFGPPSVVGGQVRTFPIQSSTACSIPALAQAYSFNVTVVPPGGLLYLTLFPATAGTQPTPPNASTLNDPSGTIIANAAIVPAGTDGTGGVDVFASSATDLIIDINGYYAAPTDLNFNTALGNGALASNTTGAANTATGNGALNSNSTGSHNTAIGAGALQNNTAGNTNTATGQGALHSNTTGNDNTATGYSALYNNMTGNFNTATGSGAMVTNTAGINNSAFGAGALNSNTTGGNNTVSGAGAMYNNTTGCCNTAAGQAALNANTTGNSNTAIGGSALQNNTTASNNTATGQAALLNTTTGGNNTATGQNAMASNTTGCCNTAAGQAALNANTTGSFNTAIGGSALQNNSTGNQNAAFGQAALSQNTTACCNTAIGQNAMNANTTGTNNVAVGQNALSANTTSSGNTAVGTGALSAAAGTQNTAVGTGAQGANTNPFNSIAIGWSAGHNVAGGSNNIHIGNSGVAGDNNVIKIGTPGTQTSFFAAGIRGATTGSNDALPVVIDSNGQLGTVNSSARFKEDIRDMGEASSGLLQLRPVTFRYRQAFADGDKPVQYGLIAEEVEKVFPELVARSADGKIESVKYQVLDALLLNELQKAMEKIRALEARLGTLEAAGR